jgi:hypothetical protein
MQAKVEKIDPYADKRSALCARSMSSDLVIIIALMGSLGETMQKA